MTQTYRRWLCGLVLAGVALATQAHEGRVIVKYKVSALKQVQSADRGFALAGRTGLTLRSGRHLDEQTEVLFGAGYSSEALARRLAADPSVEYVVPDRLRRVRALPSDPLYPELSPLVSGQWYLQGTQLSATRANVAWDTTTGSPDIVVAFVDTGVRYDHPDLAGKLLPGYDFISDAPNAGDGNGRDADASDAGDYITSEEAASASLQAVCGDVGTSSSSWHGTRVAGIIGASSNNAVGIAGMAWNSKLLPIRALGKCGGYDSDIIAGMRWAAGLSVPGIPANPNPARVINLSLGASGSCDASYIYAISEIVSRGTTIVASAGNSSGPVESPANCPNVLAVAGVRNVGTKVGYSSFGPQVSVSAPAGNCVNSYGACLYSILTTTNSGSTVPATNTYTDQYDYNIGTSFAAPQVAGIAALMLAVNPGLTPAEVISRIKASARAFPPPEDGLVSCPNNPDASTTVIQCNCTTTTCGAGMADAAAAVAAVAPPSAIIQVLDPLSPNALVRLDGSGSSAVTGESVVAWQWQLISAPAGASLTALEGVTTSLQTTSVGTYVVALSVTDSAGAKGTVQRSLDVVASLPGADDGSTSTPVVDEGNGGGGGGAFSPGALLALFGLLALAIRRPPKVSLSSPAT